MHRDTTQVPLIVRAPGLVPAGTAIERVVSLASLPATICELVGDPAHVFPGPSLASLLRDPAADAGDAGSAIQELARHPWPEYKNLLCYSGALRSIVRGRWHFIRHAALGDQLFDRIADPREETRRPRGASRDRVRAQPRSQR